MSRSNLLKLKTMRDKQNANITYDWNLGRKIAIIEHEIQTRKDGVLLSRIIALKEKIKKNEPSMGWDPISPYIEAEVKEWMKYKSISEKK